MTGHTIRFVIADSVLVQTWTASSPNPLRCPACGIALPFRLSLARRSLIPTGSATFRDPTACSFGSVSLRHPSSSW
jgi:hypothetical protein